MVEHTAKEVVSLLKENGFLLIKIRGDHHKFSNNKGRIAIINYKSLKDSISEGVYKDVLAAMKGQSKWQRIRKKR